MLYVLVFRLFENPEMPVLPALAAFPIALFGVFFGVPAGLGAAIAFIALNVVLLDWIGFPGSSLGMMLAGPGLPGTINGIAIGIGSGMLHELGWRWLEAMHREQALTEKLQQRNEVMQGPVHIGGRRSHDLQLLNRIGNSIGSRLDLDKLFPEIVGVATELVEAESVSIVLPDQEKRELIFRASVDGANGYRMPWGTGIISQIMDSGRGERVEDLSADRRYHVEMERISGVKLRDGLFAPIINSTEVLGVICAVNSKIDGFDDQHMEILTLLASQAGIAIQNARLFRSERDLRLRADGLQGASLLLASQLGLQDLLVRHLDHLATVVDFDCAAVFLRAAGELVCVAARNQNRALEPGLIDLALASPIIDQLRVTGKPLILADAGQDHRYRESGALHGTHGWMAIPLAAQGELIGCMTVHHNQIGRYGEKDLAPVLPFAAQAAQAVENARLYGQLSRQAEELEARVAERTQSLDRRINEVEMLNSAMQNLLSELQAVNRRYAETAQRLEKANGDLRSFGYSVSHDLRAPLRGIRGFTDILLRKHQAEHSPEVSEYLNHISEAGNQMHLLIDDLLTYTRVGFHAIRKIPVPITRVFEQAEINLQALILEKSAIIRYPQVDAAPALLGDPTLCSQIFTNLIENALTYSKPGEIPEVEVSWDVSDQMITVHISDSGIGIDEAFHEKIFNVFQRLNPIDSYPGTGIGLAIVRRAAGLLGYEIGLSSSPGQGSTFSVTAPMAERDTLSPRS